MNAEDEDSKASDPLREIEAMRLLTEALQPLSGEARARVLTWATDHFRTPTLQHRVPQTVSAVQAAQYNTAPTRSVAQESEFDDLADLYAAVSPRTDAERALAVCYWIQEIEGEKGIDAQRVNTELKHLGHGVTNITRAFDKLKSEKPQFVIQTKKAGVTKQARKTYKLTNEGKKRVEALMHSPEDAR